MTTEAQKKEAVRLGYFLAKFLDPATTDAEAAGAVNALVTRLRKMHQVGERDFVLAVVTREEAQLVHDWRNGVTGQTSPGTGTKAEGEADEPSDPFYDSLNGIFKHTVQEAAKAGAAAVTSKIPGLVDDFFKGNGRARGAKTGGA